MKQASYKQNKLSACLSAARLIAALLIGVLIFAGLTKLCQPKYYFALEAASPETEMWQAFYDLPKDSLDILFLGSSHVYNSIDPVQYEELTGLSGFDLSTSNQDASLSLYLLEEALRTQKPETVILDMYGFEMEPMSKTSSYKRTLDDMRWGVPKYRAVRDWMPFVEGETWLPRFLTLLDYHGRWSSLEDADYHGSRYVTTKRGFSPTDETASGINHDKWADEEPKAFSERTLEYFDRLVTLCRDNDIELILIKTPDSGWKRGWSYASAELAGRYGLTFTDYNEPEALAAIGLDDTTDWRNKHHLNARGAVKFTEYLAEALSYQTEGKNEKIG